MAHTVNSVLINAPYDKVFDVSNDIGRWKEFFDEYTESDVVEKSANKLTFKLTHKNGSSWQSYRLLFKDDKYKASTQKTKGILVKQIISKYHDTGRKMFQATFIDHKVIKKGLKKAAQPFIK